MKKILGFGLTALLVSPLFLAGCKPTEKGYKSAYDAAVNKRNTVNAEMETAGTAVTDLQAVDGPELRTYKGQNYYYMAENLSVMEATPFVMLNYNVAVGCFSMPTNCVALVNDLKKENIDAFGAKSADNKYYAIIGTFDTLDDAIAWYVMYDSASPKAYLGLPGAPVIIFTK